MDDTHLPFKLYQPHSSCMWFLPYATDLYL